MLADTKHIVVIEDDPDIRAVISLLMETEGFRVTALEYVASIDEVINIHTDCFILDERLPVINGHILSIILKSKPQTKHVPIILVSASPELEGKATLCEADFFLRKPFDNHQLVKLVNTSLFIGQQQGKKQA